MVVADAVDDSGCDRDETDVSVVTTSAFVVMAVVVEATVGAEVEDVPTANADVQAWAPGAPVWSGFCKELVGPSAVAPAGAILSVRDSD